MEKPSPFRVAVYVNIPSQPRYYNVPDAKTGLIVIEAIADEHNKLTELSTKAFGAEIVASNVFTLQKWDASEGAYLDWEDDDGNNIDAFELDENLEMVLK